MTQRCNNMPIGSIKMTAPPQAMLVALGLAVLFSSGCASLTNPIANGIPVRLLPPELLAESREELEDIPLSWLRQSPPDRKLLGPNDILGVYIENVLGGGSGPSSGQHHGRRSCPIPGLSTAHS